MVNIIDELSKLTTIPDKPLNRLSEIIIYLINDSVEDEILKGENSVDLDLEVGILTIKFDNNELKFKFTPSAKLEDSLIDTIKNKENLLRVILETSLINKITEAYKDLF